MIAKLLGFTGSAKGLATVGGVMAIGGFMGGMWLSSTMQDAKEKRVIDKAFDRLVQQQDVTTKANRLLLTTTADAQKQLAELARDHGNVAAEGFRLRKQLGDALNDIPDTTPCACTDTLVLNGVQQSISKAYTEPLVNLTPKPATDRPDP